jgi:hypothetical protein
MARRHRVRLRQQAQFPQMKMDRAMRRIARFSDVRTWHPDLQKKYIAMMKRRFGRTVEIVPRQTFRGGIVPSTIA